LFIPLPIYLPLVQADTAKSEQHTDAFFVPDELWEKILTYSPDISEHVRFTAVCHGWRVMLARRESLSALPIQTRWPLAVAGRGPAMLAVLSHCTALVSLLAPWDVLAVEFFTALGRLECARTLRTLTVPQSLYITRDIPVECVLAALPALEFLDTDRGVFGLSEGATLQHARLQALSCACTRAPPVALWTTGLPALRRLRVRLPDDRTARRQLMDNLHTAVVPRLEALHLAGAGIEEGELICLLSGASANLRELTVRDCTVRISEAFRPFVAHNLLHLEKVELYLNDQSEPVRSAISDLLDLPCLREAVLWACFGAPFDLPPLELRKSPLLQRLRLELPCPVAIAMPQLRSLTLQTTSAPPGSSRIDCPALEELVVDSPLDVAGCGPLPALRSLTYPTTPPPALLAITRHTAQRREVRPLESLHIACSLTPVPDAPSAANAVMACMPILRDEYTVCEFAVSMDKADSPLTQLWSASVLCCAVLCSAALHPLRHGLRHARPSSSHRSR